MVVKRLRQWTRRGNLGAKILAILFAIFMITSVVLGVFSYILQ